MIALKQYMQSLALILAVMVFLVLGWYGQSRVLASWRNVRQITLQDLPASALTGDFLKLAAYNIAHGRGGRYGADNWTGASKQEIIEHLTLVARQVKDSDADIVVLNEADFQCTWSKSINQARLIARLAGYAHVVEQRSIDVSLPFRVYRFGNAILSKHPVTSARAIHFPPMSRLESILAGNKDGLMCTIDTPGALGEVSVIAVHLEHRSEETRIQCARVILDLAREQSGPFIVMGDYNTTPSFAINPHRTPSATNTIDLILESGLLSAGDQTTDWDSYLTFPSEAPDRAIDWILCSPHLSMQPPVVIHSSLSDHLMVTMEVTPAQSVLLKTSSPSQ